ncbi:hypothetical protein FOZ62_030096, partial [Perkinsus olseni]
MSGEEGAELHGGDITVDGGTSENVYTWTQKWATIQMQLNQLHRECDELLGSSRTSNPRKFGLTNAELADLRDENKCLELAFDKWDDDLYRTLSVIRAKVREFSSTAENIREQMLRKSALELEHRITRYKSQQKVDFDSIMAEEERLSSLMENASRRFSKWQQSSFLTSSPKKYNPAAYQSCGGRPEEDPRLEGIRRAIMKIADQIDHEGGRTGGWSTADHEAFLKVVTGCPGREPEGLLREQVMDRIIRKLPSQLGHDEVKEHIDWWCRYNELEADKKALMEQYRERKELWQRKEGDDHEADLAAERRMAEKRRAAEEAARVERKRLIEQWKKEKEEAARKREEEAVASRAVTNGPTAAELERRRKEKQVGQDSGRLTAYREGKLRREQEEQRLRREREATARRCRSTERPRFEQRNAEIIRGLTNARAQREDSEIKAQRREQKKRRIKAREEEKKEQTELMDTERKKHGVVVAEKFGKAPGSFAGS